MDVELGHVGHGADLGGGATLVGAAVLGAGLGQVQEGDDIPVVCLK